MLALYNVNIKYEFKGKKKKERKEKHFWRNPDNFFAVHTLYRKSAVSSHAFVEMYLPQTGNGLKTGKTPTPSPQPLTIDGLNKETVLWQQRRSVIEQSSVKYRIY